MTPENLVDIQMTAQDQTDAATHLAALKVIFDKYVIGLSPAQKSGLATIGPERKAIVNDFLNSMTAHPELVPGYVDMTQVARDAAAWKLFQPYVLSMQELCEGPVDTLHGLGSDLLVAFYAYYANVQMAARQSVAGAGSTLDALKVHFPRGTRKPKPPTP